MRPSRPTARNVCEPPTNSVALLGDTFIAAGVCATSTAHAITPNVIAITLADVNREAIFECEFIGIGLTLWCTPNRASAKVTMGVTRNTRLKTALSS
jgi:hypothetical protein